MESVEKVLACRDAQLEQLQGFWKQQRAEIEKLRNALGIAHAAMTRHDESGLHTELDPAGACLVNFDVEREIATAALAPGCGEEDREK